MKTIKLKLEIDLTNPAIVAAFNTLLVTMGESNFVSAASQNTPSARVIEMPPQPEKPTRSAKKTKEVPQVDTEKEKAKEALVELKEEKTVKEPETVDPIEEETPEPKTSKIDLAKVREALGLKVGEHRETIKAKLTELGANNVTTLSPEHYETMYNFLTEL